MRTYFSFHNKAFCALLVLAILLGLALILSRPVHAEEPHQPGSYITATNVCWQGMPSIHVEGLTEGPYWVTIQPLGSDQEIAFTRQNSGDLDEFLPLRYPLVNLLPPWDILYLGHGETYVLRIRNGDYYSGPLEILAETQITLQDTCNPPVFRTYLPRISR